MIGIGIISWNGIAGVKRVVAGVQQHTAQPYRLVVADDGSTDGTVEFCRANGVTVIDGDRRGCAFNTNRAYLYLSRFSDIDTYIVLEQDAVPNAAGWDVRWTEAARKMGHVVYAWVQERDFEAPPNDPPWVANFGAQCVATSREAFDQVGYYDPSFYELNYSSAHAEWSYRFARHLNFPRAEFCLLLPGLTDGVEQIDIGSGRNLTEVERSHQIQRDIGQSGAVYRLPWRTDAERDEFLDRRPITEFKNKHSGQDIWIIAAGASLNHVDPSFFYGKTTIGLNQVFKRFPCKYLIRKETIFAAEAHATGIPLILSKHDTGSYRGHENWVPGQAWYFDHPDNSGVPLDCITPTGDQIIVSASTITSAMHVAAYMGALNIIVCGHDCGLLDGQANFDGYYAPGYLEQAASRGHDYAAWLADIESQSVAVRERLQQVYGCRIYSLNPFLNFGLEGHVYEGRKPT